MIESVIGRIAAGEDLSMDEMADVIGLVIDGRCRDEEIGLLLTGLAMKGETAGEIAGAARALRAHMTPIRSSRRDELLDTCGTGGDGSRTFNISTTAAIVTAAAGVPVAKHGNLSITSKSGSADVLAELGVNIHADVATVERCLDELGLCFCFAPLLHRSLKNVAHVRKALGIPTIFNRLGPLANPAQAPYQLLGVAGQVNQQQMAGALALLGTRRALVVSGRDGLDEVTLSTSTDVVRVEAGMLAELTWEPGDFGLEPRGLESMLIEDARSSAAIVRRVLAGEPGAARDIVLLNAAAALFTAGRTERLVEGVRLAAEAIDSGAASSLLARLAERSHAPA